jgi:hypothetical protein
MKSMLLVSLFIPVLRFNRLYYQYQPHRLSTCPLTLHALLHIAWGIRVAGPVWAYWAYPMERHCNMLLPSIKSRRHPYASINAFVTAMAQIDQIRLKYNCSKELTLSVYENAATNPAHFLTHDSCTYYHCCCLDILLTFYLPVDPLFKLCPPKRVELIPISLHTKIYSTLATRFNTNKAAVQGVIKLDQPILQYGKVTHLEGDCMLGADLSSLREDGQDSTYIKVRNASEYVLVII